MRDIDYYVKVGEVIQNRSAIFIYDFYSVYIKFVETFYNLTNSIRIFYPCAVAEEKKWVKRMVFNFSIGD